MKLVRRSKSYVLFHLPNMFIGHYKILRRSNPVIESIRCAYLLTIGMFRNG